MTICRNILGASNARAAGVLMTTQISGCVDSIAQTIEAASNSGFVACCSSGTEEASMLTSIRILLQV